MREPQRLASINREDPRFRDVDRSECPEELIAFLDRRRLSPDARDGKRLRAEFLLDGRAGPMLDIGCGTGEDTVLLGDTACGIDSSIRMLGEARSRHPKLTLVGAKAEALPLSSGSIQGIFVERVLQHVADVSEVVAELDRVAAVGCRFAILEPDYTAVELHGISSNRVTGLAITERSRRIRHPNVLPSVFRLLGNLQYSQVEEFRFESRTVDYRVASELFPFRTVVDSLVANGDVSSAEGGAWIAELLERHRAKTFLMTTVGVVISATK